MADLKLIFVFSCVLALVGLSQVEAASKLKREVEANQEQEPGQIDAVQRQLTQAFDTMKKTMEDLASKFNADDIVQGVQNLTSKLESYVKETADHFASTASGTTTKKEGEHPTVQQTDSPSP